MVKSKRKGKRGVSSLGKVIEEAVKRQARALLGRSVEPTVSTESIQKSHRHKVKGVVQVIRGNRIKKSWKKPSTKKRVKSLKARVTELEKTKHTAIHGIKTVSYGQITSAENQCSYNQIDLFTRQNMESSITGLNYFDRGATPAPDTINATGQTKRNEIYFKNMYAGLKFRNNNALTCRMRCYFFECKKAGAGDITGQMLAEDQYFLNTATSTTDYLVYPSDFKALKDQWKLLGSQEATLQPGDEFLCNHTVPYRSYDNTASDVESNPNYMPGDRVCLCRITGVIGHDSVQKTSEFGICGSALDYEYLIKWDVLHPSDFNTQDCTLTNNASTASNGFITFAPTNAAQSDAV